MSDLKTYYIVGAVIENRKVSVFGAEAEIKMNWAPGMLGVLPVFDNYEDAEKYADGKFQVLQFEGGR